MPYALTATNGELLAGMADGRILHSDDGGQSWGETGVRTASITAMASTD
jgi:photosystem II stability/assembly factor-like uncharacterized protein